MIYRLDDLFESQDFEHDEKFVKAIHWKEACDEIEDKVKTIIWKDQRIKQLEDALRDMGDSLEFYADRFSWEWSSHPNLESYSGEIRNDSSLVKYVEADGEEYQNHCGGKRAREVLSRNAEILDTINKRGEE